MFELTPEPPLFAGVRLDHPFAAQVDVLREAVAGHLAGERGVRLTGTRHVRSAELKGRRLPPGSGPGAFELVRVYCSLQTWHPCDGVPFVASTLHWAPGTGSRWAELADEPYLGDLEALLRDQGLLPDAQGRVEVLRYVPTRRFTVLAAGAVTKVKRPSKLLDSADRVAAVVAAATGTDVRVPAPLGVDVERGSYAQAQVVGDSMAELASGSANDLLAEAGAVHAAFHALTAPGLPAPETAGAATTSTAAAVRRDADWAAFFRPELAELLAATRDLLVGTAPAPSAAVMGTCHGDLVPSHLLAADDGWTIIDLDLAHRGDRYRDLALFLAGLPGDVAALADGTAPPGALAAAESAYLTSYAHGWGRTLDPRRLAWHRAAAELRHLALMFSKDTLRPGAVERIVSVLEETCAVLADPRANAS